MNNVTSIGKLPFVTTVRPGRNTTTILRSRGKDRTTLRSPHQFFFPVPNIRLGEGEGNGGSERQNPFGEQRHSKAKK